MAFKLPTYRAIIKKFYVIICYPLIAVYIKKARPFKHEGLNMTILPGVFHPGFFFSTKFFFSFINRLEVAGKKCLEVGCGSGLLSLLLLRKNGLVTAIDINPKALENTKINFEKNKKQFNTEIKLIQSDLFDQVPADNFSVVIIAPPYFFDEVTNESEYAWYCGKNGEYFTKLFTQLTNYITADTVIYMILADNCDIPRIQNLAKPRGYNFVEVARKRIWWEDNYIFQIHFQNQ